MKSRKGISSGVLVVVAIVGLLALGVVSGSLNIGADAGDEQAEIKDATLNLAASQLGSSSKISTTAYAQFQDGTVVSKSLSSGQYTSWGIFTNQDSDVTVSAFDSSNYPIEETVGFDGSTQLNEEIKTAKIASASDVSLEARESSGSSDNDDTLKIAAGGQETIDSLRTSVDTQDVYFNAGRIGVSTPSDSNVTVKMPNNEEVSVPDSSSADKMWKAYNPSEGDATFEDFAEYNSNNIVVEGDDSNDPSETITFYVNDLQGNQNSDTGELEYAVEDNSDSDLGLSEQSLSTTIN